MAKPAHAQAVIAQAVEQALALHRGGWLDKAEALYREILKVSPGHFDALHLLGLINQQCGRPAEALRLIDAALAVDPQSSAALSNRGAVLNALSLHAEALASLDQAIALDPGNADAHGNRGGALNALGRHAEALESYERCLALNPQRADALCARGDLLARLGRAEAALASYRAALRHTRDTGAIHNDIGITLAELGRPAEALEAFTAARDAGLDVPERTFNEALTRIALGDFATGFALYEARWGKKDLAPQQRDFAQPLWCGEQIAGKTILLHAEQGLGDTIHFVRYAPLVAARGATVVLEVQPPLKSLIQDLAPVVLARGEPLPAFDLHCPLLSLPHAFATELATIPRAPYLTAPTDRAAVWASGLAHLASPRIGIAWAGKASQKHDHARSIPLAALLPLLETPGVSFVSLQHELREGDAALLDAAGVTRLAPFADFADTAAVVAALDLVIAVDTSVAHLAAAMGKPLWLFLPYGGDWHWVAAGCDDSPWYPSARLFRQNAPGDWSGTITAMRQALTESA